MYFTNEYMVVPYKDHLRVFYNGDLIAEVDTYEEACEEIEEAQKNN